jgi:hypothetical protein
VRYIGRAPDELLEAFLKHGAFEKDAAATGQTPQADVGAETDDLPVRAAARVRLPQPHHVVEGDLEDRG